MFWWAGGRACLHGLPHHGVEEGPSLLLPDGNRLSLPLPLPGLPYGAEEGALVPLTRLEWACCRSKAPPRGPPLAEGPCWLSSPWRDKNLRDRVVASALAPDPSLDSSRPKGFPLWSGQHPGATGTARLPRHRQQVSRGQALSPGHPSSRAPRGTATPKAGPRGVGGKAVCPGAFGPVSQGRRDISLVTCHDPSTSQTPPGLHGVFCRLTGHARAPRMHVAGPCWLLSRSRDAPCPALLLLQERWYIQRVRL